MKMKKIEIDGSKKERQTTSEEENQNHASRYLNS
jgi:hypothetical protein